jgi:hypothetical protein
MDYERLNRWITLGANVAVLAGIALLIVELDQNHDTVRAQTRNEISQGELMLLSSMSGNKELTELLIRAGQGRELSDAERLMVTTQSESAFRLWQNVHYQGRNGLYDDEEFAKHVDTMRSVLSHSPWLVEYWCNNRQLYPAKFVAEIDGLISSESCLN